MKRVFEHDRKVSRATIQVAIYLGVLLLCFALGVIENRVDSEGMGFLPLLALASPWSWLGIALWHSPMWGNDPQAHLAIFMTCNVSGGGLNGCILYRLARWRQPKGNVAGAIRK